MYHPSYDGSGGMHQYPWGMVPTVDDKPNNPYHESEYRVGYHENAGNGRPLSSASTAYTYGASLSRPVSGMGLGMSRPVSRSTAGLNRSRAGTAPRSRSVSAVRSNRQLSASQSAHGARSARPFSAQTATSSGTTVRARPLSGVPRSSDRWQGLGHQPDQSGERQAAVRPTTAGAFGRSESSLYARAHETIPPRMSRTHSAPHIRGPPPPPRSAFSNVEVYRTPTYEVDVSSNAPVPRLLPLKNAPASLSGMKREMATLKGNINEIQDRQDSARGLIEEFRTQHDFPTMCEELKAQLWPEIIAARAEITDMFEEMRMETYELQQQVDLLKHEKNSIAYVLFRMDQKVKQITEIIGHR